MSRLVEFDDLNMLDGQDLRAVFGQVDRDLLLDSLAGLDRDDRKRLLTKLPAIMAIQLESALGGRDSTQPETTHLAQRTVIEILCRLSHRGLVAFTDPEDILPEARVA